MTTENFDARRWALALVDGLGLKETQRDGLEMVLRLIWEDGHRCGMVDERANPMTTAEAP